MVRRIAVIGGSAAGMGAAGAAKQVDADAHVIVFTDQQDVAYSPCGIPYVHGREIDTFDRLILQGREYYQQLGYDIRYGTLVAVHRPRGAQAERGGRGRRAVRQPGDRHRLRVRAARHRRHRPGGHLLRPRHPRGDALGRDPRADQGRRGGGGAADRRGDGHGPGPPGHRDAPGRSASVGHGRHRRPGHHAAGGGLLARDGRQAPLQHARRGAPRAREACERSRPPAATSRSIWW